MTHNEMLQILTEMKEQYQDAIKSYPSLSVTEQLTPKVEALGMAIELLSRMNY